MVFFPRFHYEMHEHMICQVNMVFIEFGFSCMVSKIFVVHEKVNEKKGFFILNKICNIYLSQLINHIFDILLSRIMIHRPNLARV